MSETTANNLGALLRSFEGMRNWRALVLMIGGVVSAALVLYGGFNVIAHVDSTVMGLIVRVITGLLALLLFLIRLNGAGLLLVDQIDQQPYRNLAQAFFGGIGCTLWAVLASILLALALLVLWVALATLSFLDRIPGIGPFFAFLLSGPTAVVFAFCFVFMTLGVPLVFVSIWRGHNAIGAIGRAVDIVIQRPLETFIHFLVLWLIVFSATAFAFGMLSLGGSVTFDMHAIVDLASNLPGMGGHGSDYGMGGSALGMLFGGVGNLVMMMGAAWFSIMLMYLVLFSMLQLIYLAGSLLVHDSLSAGVNATSASRMRAGLQDFKRKIDESRPRAAPPAQSSPPAAQRCPSCGAAVVPGDVFCGGCGHRM